MITTDEILATLRSLRPNEIDCNYHPASIDFCFYMTNNPAYIEKANFPKCKDCKIRINMKQIVSILTQQLIIGEMNTMGETYLRHRYHQMNPETLSRIVNQLLENIAKTKPEYKAMHPRKAVERIWQNPYFINSKNWGAFWIYLELVSLFKKNCVDSSCSSNDSNKREN